MKLHEKSFEWLFNRWLKNLCVPSEGNKEKAEGCYNALNDYGKEPTEAACRRCWIKFLEEWG